jgi:hypothetical protein
VFREPESLLALERLAPVNPQAPRNAWRDQDRGDRVVEETVGRAMKASAFSNSAPGGAEQVAIGNTGGTSRS